MEVQNVMRMKGGEGDTSYAKNSGFQEGVISKAKPILQNTIIDLFSNSQSPKCFTIADLGCSSGRNALLVIWEIFEAIESICKKMGQASPELQVFLNDLPGNDWSTLFKSIPDFTEKIKTDMGDQVGPFFLSARPGSFYGRLFPTVSLNFVHSSYSLQILSQVPPGIENNKRNIFIAPTSPPNVSKAYLTQFQTDFKLFLTSRSQELVPGGRMVLIFVGRSSSDVSCKEVGQHWDLLAQSLRDMVSEGLVEEAKLDSFNWPGYYPTCEELKAIVEEQRTLILDLLEVIEEKWDPSTDLENIKTASARGKYVANFIRAVAEPTLIGHFGEEIINDLFDRYAVHIGKRLAKENGKLYNVIMCMTKKE